MTQRARYPELASWLRQHWHRSEDARVMAIRHHDNGGWTLRELEWAKDFKKGREDHQERFASREPSGGPEVGFYKLGPQFFRVQRNRAGTANYAKLWAPMPDCEDVPLEDVAYAWRYVAREPFEFLTPHNRLTKAEAMAFGHEWGRCIVCDAELKTEDSLLRGMGPVCYDKYT